MQYELRHISLGRVIRLTVAVGGFLLLCPALCVAGLVVRSIQIGAGMLGQLEHVEVQLPSVDLGITTLDLPNVPINVIEQLGLAQQASVVQGLSTQLSLLFLFVLVLAVAFGLLMLLVSVSFFTIAYNILAQWIGGFVVDLKPGEKSR